jgi:hypothetical protein
LCCHSLVTMVAGQLGHLQLICGSPVAILYVFAGQQWTLAKISLVPWLFWPFGTYVCWSTLTPVMNAA